MAIPENAERGTQLLLQSNHVLARIHRKFAGIDREDMRQVYQLLNTECDTSDPHVQFMLGYCHRFGKGCVENETQAAQCFERAGNHLIALYSLANMFEDGTGVVWDITRAAELLRHAAEQGFSIAQNDLGRKYEQGSGVPRDLQQAEHWYTLAAQQGNEDALERIS
eukprot:TRINITY_DN7513_c0_g2_i1.p1 TRINITY_DN7513_c0_g2~~TRINITY_DN7513_c0_g2_i1.p1  ORF type:complete len:190 (-),score=43.27 TRINITY_DN7513_c0_g2_i1:259-756(-)